MSEFALNFSRNIDLIYDVAGQTHIADKITELILQKEMSVVEVPAVLHEILIKDWNYIVKSVNLLDVPDSEVFFNNVSKWKVCDIVLLYHHPDLGAICINPKNPAHKEYIADFRKNELVIVYCGYTFKKDSDDLCEQIANKCVDLLCNKKVKAPEKFLKGSYGYKKPKTVTTKTTSKVASKDSTKKTEVTSQKTASTKTAFSFGDASKSDVVNKPTTQQSNPASLRKMTPMISVQVTNELFHNGNVEAWKRIIASYTNKYPKLQIFVYYDGERITDINALFKWGKVKHGSCIQFVVAGDNIQDVAKLKRYFTQGASPMFEAFLQGAPGSVLPLF